MVVKPRCAGAWLALAVAMFCCNCTAGQFEYDWSSPRSAFASLQRAFAQKDRDAIAAGLYSPILAPAEAEAQIKQEPVEKLMKIGYPLYELSVRHVDKTLYYALQQDLQKTPKPFDDVARVVCTFENREGAWPREQKHVWALYFVRCGSRWQWHMDMYRFFEKWSYDFSSPQKAYESMLKAISHEDVFGVYDLIDPRMRTGIDRGVFMSTALERLNRTRKWEEENRAAEEQAKGEGHRAPNPPPAPFKAFRGRSENNFETEPFTQDGRECARVWQLRPPQLRLPNNRVASEEFVKDGDQWYWRPKAEYTVWCDMPASTQPASQPAP